MHPARRLALAVTLVCLAACGGSDDTTPDAPRPVDARDPTLLSASRRRASTPP